jgi:membrane protease YdiL (CAAX protease family)
MLGKISPVVLKMGGFKFVSKAHFNIKQKELGGQLAQVKSLKLPILIFAICILFSFIAQMITFEVGLDAWGGLGITAIFYVLLLVIAIVFVKIEEPIRNIGFKAAGRGKVVPLAVVVGMFAQIFWLLLIAAASGALSFSFGALGVEVFLARLLLMAFFVGFVEELIFRGYIQRRLTAAYGFGAALLITALLFMALHIQTYTYFRLMDPAVQAALQITSAQAVQSVLYSVTQTVIGISALGVFTGYLYFKSGQSVFTSMTLHITFNTFGLFALSYSNLGTAAGMVNLGVFAILWFIWAAVVGLLVWVITKTAPKVRRVLPVRPRFISSKSSKKD